MSTWLASGSFVQFRHNSARLGLTLVCCFVIYWPLLCPTSSCQLVDSVVVVVAGVVVVPNK